MKKYPVLLMLVFLPDSGRLLAAPEISPESIAEAGGKFRENCLSCHFVPDKRIASDRAWIGQIQETA